MNNKDYITLYSTFAMLCYFQHNIANSGFMAKIIHNSNIPLVASKSNLR